MQYKNVITNKKFSNEKQKLCKKNKNYAMKNKRKLKVKQKKVHHKTKERLTWPNKKVKIKHEAQNKTMFKIRRYKKNKRFENLKLTKNEVISTLSTRAFLWNSRGYINWKLALNYRLALSNQFAKCARSNRGGNLWKIRRNCRK